MVMQEIMYILVYEKKSIILGSDNLVHVCMYVRTYVRMYVCMLVCMYVYHLYFSGQHAPFG